MFLLCSRYVKHAHYTHTEAIPEWSTQCTRGVIYYTEPKIPRTITDSLSNRLKMVHQSVESTNMQTHSVYECVLVIQALLALCV